MFDSQAIVLATLAASLLLFVTDALRYDLIAVLVALVLAITGCLEPEQAFAGFSSPAIVLIASMYVYGHAISKWGVAEIIGQRLLARGATGPGSEPRLVLQITLVSGLLSSVLSNTGVVASLIPVLSSVARRCQVPVSRLLMPLSFGSLLGGMLSVIGTSTNIAVNGAIKDVGGEEFSLFEFSHFGLICLGVGCLYWLSPVRGRLSRSRAGESLTEHYRVPQFVTEVLVEPTSTLINRTVAESGLFERHGISVLGIARPGETSTLAPGPYNRIRHDDTLILQGEPDAILKLRQDLGLRERKSVSVGDTRLVAADVQLVEAVVPAGSPLVGSTLADVDFRAQTGLNVLGISKHGHVRPASLGNLPLEIGDTLLLQGHEPDIERARRKRELLVLGELETQPIGRGALITLLTLALVLLVAALELVDLTVAALGGAVALVLTGVIKPDEVRRNLDWSVLILIGGMLFVTGAQPWADTKSILAGVAIFLATINVAGGFLVTHRMLKMFRKE